jgi:hypothetical protein
MKMKYFRMLKKESSKNPNMVPIGSKGEKFLGESLYFFDGIGIF